MNELFGWIGTALFTICYIPQIVKTYRTKNVHDVSLVMWLIQWVAYSSCLVYAISLKAMPMIIGYSLGWLMTAWWLELYRQFKNPPPALRFINCYCGLNCLPNCLCQCHKKEN